MLITPLASGLAMLVFGISALRLNARRPTNLALAGVCFVSVVMFAFQFIARYYGARYVIDHVSNPMPWVRLRFACIGFLCPFMVWTCYYVVSGRYSDAKDLTRKLIPWAIVSVALMLIPFTEAFKSSASRPGLTLDGPLYTVYFAVMLACELGVCVASIVTAQRLTGIRRLEFRFITIAFGYLSMAAIVAALIHDFFRVPVLLWIVQTLSFLVFLVFGVSAWCVTSRRVYHSSQIVLPIAERLVLAAFVAVPALFVIRRVRVRANPWPEAAVIGLACAAYCYADEKVRAGLNLKSEQRLAAITRELRNTASGESEPARLVANLETVLRAHVSGSQVRILSLEMDHYEAGAFVLTTQELRNTPLLTDGWVSTASLARLTKQAHTDALRSRLERESLHLLVAPRWSEAEPSVIVAFGERENRLPFTHPEIEMLRTLSDIVDGLYTRARFALQARQAERLAAIGLVGAGIAHELRNPIASIETFGQLLPRRLNDPEFLRDFAEIVPGEAARIKALAGQLLDLSRPREYQFGSVNLSEVIGNSLLLLKQRASAARVELRYDAPSRPLRIVADERALKQVFINLLLNSIQSIAQTGRPGRVDVRAEYCGDTIIIETEDNGPGIPEPVRVRLFRPFASAGKSGGLGLGLATCAEIARVHHGRIRAEDHAGGALFRMVLPIAGPRGNAPDVHAEHPSDPVLNSLPTA